MYVEVYIHSKIFIYKFIIEIYYKYIIELRHINVNDIV